MEQVADGSGTGVPDAAAELRGEDLCDPVLGVFCQLEAGHLSDKNPASVSWFPAS